MASEHDACALVAVARKDARPARAVLELVLHGMAALAHRSGVVDGEGDGAGVLTDIPRALWAQELERAGHDESAVELERFAVGHFFHTDPSEVATIVAILARRGVETLLVRAETTDEAALGPRGRTEAPLFLQLALLAPRGAALGSRALYEAGVDVERATTATVVSLSRHTAVYKLRGAGHQLTSYFSDLADPLFATSVAFGHNRYATNTSTSFTRVQPFPVFAHNGEINTISRLREEARALGLPLSRDGSDSQDVDATIRALVIRHGLTAVEAIELLFPPIVNEMKRMSAELQDAYVQGRAVIGPIAQGPAGILVRVGDTCVFGVDALGLRPLWHVETEDEHVFASERGFIPLEKYVSDPVPLAPGERVALRRDRGWRLLDQGAVRERFLTARRLRGVAMNGLRSHLVAGGPAEPLGGLPHQGPLPQGAGKRWEIGTPPDEMDDVSVRRERQFAALGFEPDDLRMATFMMQTGNEPIGSLGYDGPLAALAPRANLADHLHETVAVVTNPAIDREREIEHFSTRVLLGPRPAPHAHDARRWIELATPLLLGGHPAWTGLRSDDFRALARQKGTWLVNDVVARFTIDAKVPPVILEADRDWEEHPRDALARLGASAARGVRAGAQLVVIRDHGVMTEGRAWLDPHLVIAAAHRALVAQPSLRRDCALVVSAGSIRNLHDVMVALALGADAVNPYLLLEYAIATADPDALGNLVEALRKGIEKVMSTLGIHELRGYGRQLSGVGLAPEVARFAGLETFCATDEIGLGWDRIAEEGFARASMLRERRDARLEPAFRIWPRAWKSALAVANGEAPYASYAEKLRELETLHPVSLRHLVDFTRPLDDSGGAADTSAGEHAAPFYISSMSFGSQGETAYRSYAEAMARLDLLCINGEGGELPDLIGRYPRNRGQQIASGRFGVSALLANSSNYLEIKIGQGAKPGEGGHLPARKVSMKVALARNAQPGIDLISPSNNHDIYSIEDLAQVVHELKTVNPRARVSVKVPVVPDIGVIAVGIAKAGADIVTLSGYDGGTGAARQHALRRAGLPVEIGVAQAHRALVASGLRDVVEIWCDGGMKSALDVAKMLCLGADRVGFGTLAMVAIGCTICRGCQLDTCHVGIATQLESVAEATDRGVKRFEPREFERAVENLVRFFTALREELARIAAQLGVSATTDLVGRTDLLAQARGLDRVDLRELLEPVTWTQPGRREVRVIAGVALEEAEEDERTLRAADRFVATDASGELARLRIAGASVANIASSYREGSVAGNGFAAYATDGVALTLRGGAQDGAAKTALGGTVAILKARNAAGRFLDGSVGKCFAYGAQRGRFLVQGGADARAAIRLSGAQVVFGGDLRGFAFEYMTGGTAVVLGDPGRWICSGMSGGVVYLRHDPARGLDDAALRDRFAKGAKVHMKPPRDEDLPALRELIDAYADALVATEQYEAAAYVRSLLEDAAANFRAIRPGADITDQTVSTE